MDYIGLLVRNSQPSTWNDIIVALLSNHPFESFEDIDDGVAAYIPADLYLDSMCETLSDLPEEANIKMEVKTMPRENWNAVWENAFDPVIIDKLCCIYAPFHNTPDKNAFQYTMCIMPRMAFGTGHHATTRQMIAAMNAAIDFEGKDVLDMGCGTGVLGLFARMKGAKHVHAIDVDEWAVENTIENFNTNDQQPPEYTACGDRNSTPEKANYGIILANINRNVLLEDIPTYAQHLKPGGDLLLSGFYPEDIAHLEPVWSSVKLLKVQQWEYNNWVVLHLKK